MKQEQGSVCVMCGASEAGRKVYLKVVSQRAEGTTLVTFKSATPAMACSTCQTTIRGIERAERIAVLVAFLAAACCAGAFWMDLAILDSHPIATMVAPFLLIIAAVVVQVLLRRRRIGMVRNLDTTVLEMAHLAQVPPQNGKRKRKATVVPSVSSEFGVFLD